MSDTIRKVDYYSTQISNKPGEAFKVLSALASAGIDLLAFSGFPRGRRSQIDVVPEDGRIQRGGTKGGIRVQPEEDRLRHPG
jgi:hypothetical protein